MDAYQRIGELIPLLSQYESWFRNQPQMSRALTLIYEDILNFHWKAMKYFKQRSRLITISSLHFAVLVALTSRSVEAIVSCALEKFQHRVPSHTREFTRAQNPYRISSKYRTIRGIDKNARAEQDRTRKT